MANGLCRMRKRRASWHACGGRRPTLQRLDAGLRIVQRQFAKHVQRQLPPATRQQSLDQLRREAIAEHPRRRARHHRVGRHVAIDQRLRADHRAGADLHPIEDQRVTPDPYIVADPRRGRFALGLQRLAQQLRIGGEGVGAQPVHWMRAARLTDHHPGGDRAEAADAGHLQELAAADHVGIGADLQCRRMDLRLAQLHVRLQRHLRAVAQRLDPAGHAATVTCQGLLQATVEQGFAENVHATGIQEIGRASTVNRPLAVTKPRNGKSRPSTGHRR